MASSDPAASIREAWRRLRDVPFGPAIFSRLLGRFVPYSGTVGAKVLLLEPGRAQVELRDRRRVRNHLRSIHAIALANVGELATGLALNFGLPAGARAILTGIRVDYLKKARGTLIAEASCPPGEVTQDRDVEVVGEITDAGGEVVARVVARWRVGPGRQASGVPSVRADT